MANKSFIPLKEMFLSLFDGGTVFGSTNFVKPIKIDNKVQPIFTKVGNGLKIEIADEDGIATKQVILNLNFTDVTDEESDAE